MAPTLKEDASSTNTQESTEWKKGREKRTMPEPKPLEMATRPGGDDADLEENKEGEESISLLEHNGSPEIVKSADSPEKGSGTGSLPYRKSILKTPSSSRSKTGKVSRDEEDDSRETKSGILGLFRCAKKGDLLLMGIGLLFAACHGASFPILALVFGQMTNTFISQSVWGFRPNNSSQIDPLVLKGSTEDYFPTSTEPSINDSTTVSLLTSTSSNVDASTSVIFGFSTSTHDLNGSNVVEENKVGHAAVLDPLSLEEFIEYMSTFSFYYLFIGIGVLIASYVQTFCWEMASERQVNNLRRLFFSQILRQDIAWFDKNMSGELSNKLSDDLERIREGIGSKFSMVIQFVSTFISGILVGLYANWRLTSVILGVSPLLIGTSAYMARVASTSAAREQLKYGIAGGIAEEVLSSIRTVTSFGGQPREVQRYEEALESGFKLAMRKYYILAFGIAGVYFVTYGAYGLAFWYGSELIGDGKCTPGSVFTVFFSVMAGAFSLGNALPFVNAVSTAIGAASTIFGIIDRVPGIDSYSKDGMSPKTVVGKIQFKGVNFVYPSRPEVKVLKNFSLDIEPGKKVALVGSSGAGKSTVVGLLMRFYDPISGKINLDGVDIRSLNVQWLRSQIGLVSQEPVLFGTTIAENIRYGREDVTLKEIQNAAELANAHGFISSLPLGYDTLVGERGAQLSGGQKQRIAIARALVRDPKVLLLDEATSALDSHSEGVVQEALEKAMAGRTTIIIAHRLSTIRNADVIYAMKNGDIVEWGSHNELMANANLYYTLVMTQTAIDDDDEIEPGEGTKDDDVILTAGGDEQVLCSEDHSCIEAEKGISRERKKRISHHSSLSSIHADPELDRLVEEVSKERDFNFSVWRLFQLNQPEWSTLSVGLIGCCLCGAIMPVFAYFYGEIFSTFTLVGEALKQAAIFWTLMFLVLAVLSGVSFWIQLVFMCTAAEKLVMRLRLIAFMNILRQPVGWFDLDSHSSGKLITRLARDAPLVKAASGLRAGTVLSSFVTLVSALMIAFLYGWKLALLLVVGVPLIAAASYHQTMILRRYQRRDAELMEDAGRVASECIQNVRTVQSLGKEKVFNDLYMEKLSIPFIEAKKQTYIYALVYSFSQGIIFMMYAAAFRFGAYLIEIQEMEPSDVYRVFFALAFCAAAVGQSSAYLQDYTKAKLAAGLMFQLIDLKSAIDHSACTGIKPNIQGCVELKNVHFQYPNRPDVKVLRGLDVTVKPGCTLALVGTSGCGKSTTVSLLQRFYDPMSGVVMVDGYDIRTINVAHLRATIGVVTQEPVLFDCSIKENIRYGLHGLPESLKASITDIDIIKAARTANIHDFVSSLPQGYDTMVGQRGTQLSGGQKQRIAIARALIRNPKILLLDEATSALDTESEKVVQEALDKAREGRTCIIVAHRLSTIVNADNIAVFHKGRIVEQGTHEELKALRGRYYNLIKRQSL